MRDKSFLTAARAQLDSDHFGLEKIKKRLIEYLAVVRLRELNAERETVEEQRLAEIADAKGSEGKEVVVYDKNNQQQQAVVSLPTSVKARPRKSAKGPILLYVSLI